MNSTTCELCSTAGGRVIFDNGRARVVVVDEPDYPGLIRVIWNEHVREITDLAADERTALMRLVFAVEQVQRSVLAPDKMNLASLGNMTPHLHWHLIPRYTDDAHFPGPIWSSGDGRSPQKRWRRAGRCCRSWSRRSSRGCDAPTKRETHSPCRGRQPPLHGRTECAGNSLRIEASCCAAATSSSRNW